MCYVDSHIHLHDYKEQDVKNLVTIAMKHKINTFVNISSHPDDWSQVEYLANVYPQIISGYGVHPWYIHETKDNWFELLKNKIINHPEAWIGECGIDTIKNDNIEKQLEIFQKHIYLANQYGRPLVVHAVKAMNLLQSMLKTLPKRVIFHSYTGPIEWGKQIQDFGFYVGINQSILRKKNWVNLIWNLDLNHCFLETDGPYQSGDRNVETKPWDLILLAEKISEARGISRNQLRDILQQNWADFTEKSDAKNTKIF